MTPPSTRLGLSGYGSCRMILASRSASTGPASQVKGHGGRPMDGHEISPLLASGGPHPRPREVPTCLAQPRGTTPLPDVASAKRKLFSPSVTTTWAWWSSRSTVAVASVFGMSSSKPAGWRFEDTATERRS